MLIPGSVCCELDREEGSHHFPVLNDLPNTSDRLNIVGEKIERKKKKLYCYFAFVSGSSARPICFAIMKLLLRKQTDRQRGEGKAIGSLFLSLPLSTVVLQPIPFSFHTFPLSAFCFLSLLFAFLLLASCFLLLAFCFFASCFRLSWLLDFMDECEHTYLEPP